MYKSVLMSLLIASCLSFNFLHLRAMDQKKMIVCVKVANMRTGPGDVPQGVTGPALSQDGKTPGTDITQDTQLLLSEPVLVLEDDTNHPGWYKVKALLQPEFQGGQWTHCSGYVKRDDLYPVEQMPKHDACSEGEVVSMPNRWYSVGSPLFLLGDYAYPGYDRGCPSDLLEYHQKYRYGKEIRETNIIFGDVSFRAKEGFDEDCHRKSLIKALLTFVNCPYVWGGCSSYDSESKSLTGVDCSALGHLSMRAVGLIIPRNSHAQYLKSVEVSAASDLKPGDAIYVRRKDRERMNHVLFYLGGEEFIEAFGGGVAITSKHQVAHPEKLFKTRIVLASEIFGCSVTNLFNGRELLYCGTPSVLYMRTFFSSKDYVQSLRNAFFMIN